MKSKRTSTYTAGQSGSPVIHILKTVYKDDDGEFLVSLLNDKIILVHLKFFVKPSLSVIKKARSLLSQFEDHVRRKGYSCIWTTCANSVESRWCKFLGFIETDIKENTSVYYIKDL